MWRHTNKVYTIIHIHILSRYMYIHTHTHKPCTVIICTCTYTFQISHLAAYFSIAFLWKSNIGNNGAIILSKHVFIWTNSFTYSFSTIERTEPPGPHCLNSACFVEVLPALYCTELHRLPSFMPGSSTPVSSGRFSMPALRVSMLER